MTAPARQLTLDAVGVGWPVYSNQRRYTDCDSPVGGLVVEIIDNARTDPETGEIADVRLFRCIATWRPQPLQTLDAREVDLDLLYGLDRGMCAIMIRFCVRQISQKRRGWLTSDETDWLRHAWAIARAAA